MTADYVRRAQERARAAMRTPVSSRFAGAGTARVAAPVPVTGTIAEVLAWVGDDAARAGTALEAELAKPTPRSTLVDQLRAIANPDEGDDSTGPAEDGGETE